MSGSRKGKRRHVGGTGAALSLAGLLELWADVESFVNRRKLARARRKAMKLPLN
jgi:hypothetical protein